MTEFPLGEWTQVLIGDHWPSDQDLMVLKQGEYNRGTNRAGFIGMATELHDAQTKSLAEQLGITASDLRNTFNLGEGQARKIANKNGVKESSYSQAYDCALSLRQDLSNLAEEGNREIQAIQNSQQPAEAKVSQIVKTVHRYRALATFASAKYGTNVLDALQRILDQAETGQSAREFLRGQGIDLSQAFRQPIDEANLEERVRDSVNKPGSRMGFSANVENSPALPSPSRVAPPVGSAMKFTGAAEFSGHTGPSVQLASTHGSRMNITDAATHAAPSLLPPAATVTKTTSATPHTSSLSTTGTPAASPHVPALTPTSGLPLASTAGEHPSLIESALTPTQSELVKSVDSGLEPNAHFSPVTHGAPSNPLAPAESQTPLAPPSTPPVPVHAQAFDTPPSVQHAPPSDVPAPIVAAPVASVPPTTVPVTPAGPLPTYGADLRPAVAAATTAATPPSPPPLSAAPASAPVHPSSGQAGTSHPPVVRQTPAPTKSIAAPGAGIEVAVATATGAAAGAASADTTAKTRLQRLVAAVARQQPRLAWAAGDRSDHTTVLATDLASGWIPPGIAIPAAVTLLPPKRRRNKLEAMLGEVSNAATYTPVHHVPVDNEPPPTSTRPRQAPHNDELGWQLSNATQWRDGLPRLAHTLAKAASAGTGVLDTEKDLLDEHLEAISTKVLDDYPDHVNPHDVGNWQLLAAIEALVASDKTAANYHFAWFKACNSAPDR